MKRRSLLLSARFARIPRAVVRPGPASPVHRQDGHAQGPPGLDGRRRPTPTPRSLATGPTTPSPDVGPGSDPGDGRGRRPDFPTQSGFRLEKLPDRRIHGARPERGQPANGDPRLDLPPDHLRPLARRQDRRPLRQPDSQVKAYNSPKIIKQVAEIVKQFTRVDQRRPLGPGPVHRRVGRPVAVCGPLPADLDRLGPARPADLARERRRYRDDHHPDDPLPGFSRCSATRRSMSSTARRSGSSGRKRSSSPAPSSATARSASGSSPRSRTSKKGIVLRFSPLLGLRGRYARRGDRPVHERRA